MDLVAFTEEIFNGKLHFLCSESLDDDGDDDDDDDDDDRGIAQQHKRRTAQPNFFRIYQN